MFIVSDYPRETRRPLLFCPVLQLKKKDCKIYSVVLVQSLSCVQHFVTPWTVACQASLSFTISRSLLKLTSIELVMPSHYLIFCLPLLLLPSVFPSIRVFSNESALCLQWPKYWSFSFSTSPSNVYSGLIFFRIGLFVHTVHLIHCPTFQENN